MKPCRAIAVLAALHAFGSTAAADVVGVPPSIPAGNGQDATAALVAFFAALPENTTVQFPAGASYRIEGVLELKHLTGITVDGRGATFQATDPLPDFVKTESYSDWRRVRNRAHWRLEGCRDITLKNIRVIGAHPNPGARGEYDMNREAQHGFDLLGVENVVLENVHASRVFGDGCYLSKHSRHVTVRNSRFEAVGRQGIAIGSASDILIENNVITDSRRGLVDIEPYGTDWTCGDIRILGNRFGNSRLLALPMGGGGNVGAVLVANNTFEGPNGTPLVLNRTKSSGVTRGPFLFVANRGAIGGSPAPGIRVGEVDGVFIAGNHFRYPAARSMAALAVDAAPAAVFGNVFAGAASLAAGGVAPRLVEHGNALAGDTPAAVELVAVPGGYAVRTTLSDTLSAIALMRSGSTLPPGDTLTAFGVSTRSAWAWALVEDGAIIEYAAADGGTVTRNPAAAPATPN